VLLRVLKQRKAFPQALIGKGNSYMEIDTKRINIGEANPMKNPTSLAKRTETMGRKREEKENNSDTSLL
jgi:hypothetical protein